MLVVTARCGWCLVEQPQSSNMIKFPYILHVRKLFERIGVAWQSSFLHLISNYTRTPMVQRSLALARFGKLCMHVCCNSAGWSRMGTPIWSQRVSLALGGGLICITNVHLDTTRKWNTLWRVLCSFEAKSLLTVEKGDEAPKERSKEEPKKEGHGSPDHFQIGEGICVRDLFGWLAIVYSTYTCS